VFGSREAPRIKLCDFGCAKLRQDKPQFGPASGTRDWSAPEQIGSTGECKGQWSRLALQPASTCLARTCKLWPVAQLTTALNVLASPSTT
jgi:serine/threonine protein kinase